MRKIPHHRVGFTRDARLLEVSVPSRFLNPGFECHYTRHRQETVLVNFDAFVHKGLGRAFPDHGYKCHNTPHAWNCPCCAPIREGLDRS